VSTIDSAFLLAGALTAGAYFDAETAEEREIRGLADALYRRCDWAWAQNGKATVTHGWRVYEIVEGLTLQRLQFPFADRPSGAHDLNCDRWERKDQSEPRHGAVRFDGVVLHLRKSGFRPGVAG
jgi:hypothetical protein